MRKGHASLMWLVLLKAAECRECQFACFVAVRSSFGTADDNVLAGLQPCNRGRLRDGSMAPFDGTIRSKDSLGFIDRHRGGCCGRVHGRTLLFPPFPPFLMVARSWSQARHLPVILVGSHCRR